MVENMVKEWKRMRKEEPSATEKKAAAVRKVHCVNTKFESGLAKQLIFIECPHNNEEDLAFILKAMESYSADKTLFVEQGSPRQKDYYLARIKEIAKNDPRIEWDFQEDLSIWEDLMAIDDPFAKASDHIITKVRGNVVNMDPAASLSQETIDYFLQECTREFALEMIYDAVKYVCYDPQNTAPRIMKALLPQFYEEDIEWACWQLHWTYRNRDRKWERDDETRKRKTFLRERYMRLMLEKYAKDGDYVLCHPHHAQKIIKPKDEVEIPPEPELLFHFSWRRKK